MVKKINRLDLDCHVIVKETFSQDHPVFLIMASVEIGTIILHVLPQKCMKYTLLDMWLLYYEKNVTIAFC
jgi:hypothetical protein